MRQQYPFIHGKLFTSHLPQCRCSTQLYFFPGWGGGTSVQGGGGGAGGTGGTAEVNAALNRAEAGLSLVVNPYWSALPRGAVVHAQ